MKKLLWFFLISPILSPLLMAGGFFAYNAYDTANAYVEGKAKLLSYTEGCRIERTTLEWIEQMRGVYDKTPGDYTAKAGAVLLFANFHDVIPCASAEDIVKREGPLKGRAVRYFLLQRFEYKPVASPRGTAQATLETEIAKSSPRPRLNMEYPVLIMKEQPQSNLARGYRFLRGTLRNP